MFRKIFSREVDSIVELPWGVPMLTNKLTMLKSPMVHVLVSFTSFSFLILCRCCCVCFVFHNSANKPHYLRLKYGISGLGGYVPWFFSKSELASPSICYVTPRNFNSEFTRENRPGPKWKGSSSNHHFSATMLNLGGVFLVSFFTYRHPGNLPHFELLVFCLVGDCLRILPWDSSPFHFFPTTLSKCKIIMI